MLELIKERMKTVKNGKAAGKNEVTGEMIKFYPITIQKARFRSFNYFIKLYNISFTFFHLDYILKVN